MLVELVVENYAVIERVRVRFHAGFNLLSGETGSGKSLVVDALALLFGGHVQWGRHDLEHCGDGCKQQAVKVVMHGNPFRIP